jgi:hypothetical protein
MDPGWGQSGKIALPPSWQKTWHPGRLLNECMLCWETILPNTVRHPTLTVDLLAILGYYQARYAGAMYSGCGGGYLFVIADRQLPGSFPVKVRLA